MPFCPDSVSMAPLRTLYLVPDGPDTERPSMLVLVYVLTLLLVSLMFGPYILIPTIAESEGECCNGRFASCL
jgi:hypothetical protein